MLARAIQADRAQGFRPARRRRHRRHHEHDERGPHRRHRRHLPAREPLAARGRRVRRRRRWPCPRCAPLFDGLDLADSLVVNPHKWLFTPMDCSVLFTRQPDGAAPRLLAGPRVPDHARTATGRSTTWTTACSSAVGSARSSSGWWCARSAPTASPTRIRHHCQLARTFAEWVSARGQWMGGLRAGAVLHRLLPPRARGRNRRAGDRRATTRSSWPA